MIIEKCRVCGCELKTELFLKNVPQFSQYLLSNEQLKIDKFVNNLEIGKCINCKLIQLKYNVDTTKIYPSDYFWSDSHLELSKKRKKQLVLNWHNKYNFENKEILEIGGGDGVVSKSIQDLNGKITFVDESKNACKLAEQNNIKNIVNASFDAKYFKYDHFDFVIMTEVLEHINNPLDVISDSFLLLKNGGSLIIEVPNVKKILDDNLFSAFCLEHIFYFSPSSLSNIIQHFDFNILEIYSTHDNYNFVLIAEKNINKLKDIQATIEQFNKSLKTILDSIELNKKIGFWGCGCEGTSLLSQVNNLLYNKNIIVIDKDKKKTGKYVPTCHFIVNHPDDLLRNNLFNEIDIIVINSSSLKNSILDDIHVVEEKLAKKFKICSLFPKPKWIIS